MMPSLPQALSEMRGSTARAGIQALRTRTRSSAGKTGRNGWDGYRYRYLSATVAQHNRSQNQTQGGENDLSSRTGPPTPSPAFSDEQAGSSSSNESSAEGAERSSTTTAKAPALSRDMTLDAESSRRGTGASASASDSTLTPDLRTQGVQTGTQGESERERERASASGSGRMGGADDVAEEDRQFAEIFNTLKTEWPKPLPRFSRHSPSIPSRSTSSALPRAIRPSPIGPQLTFRPEDTPAPRLPDTRGPRGVHARDRRSAGQTPQEAAAFNRILADIFADLEAGSPGGRTAGVGGGGGVGATAPGQAGGGVQVQVQDAYAATRGGGFGLRATSGPPGAGGMSGAADARARAHGLRRMFEREDQEEDDELVEEIDMLKEEMEVIGTDVELVEWAKRRVFKPVPSGSASASASGSSGKPNDPTSESGPTPTGKGLTSTTSYSYSRSYPRILAHLLKTLRTNYNAPHLVLSIFQHAKTLSFESYLFGCHSSAYNELLSVKWESFRDLQGVEEGVREMEAMGVRWDAGTVRLVGKVVEEVGREVLRHQQQQQHAGQERGEGRWGKDVFDRLARLDERVQKDVREQEWFFERQQMEKRKAREERERRAERELRADADFGVGAAA